MRFRRIRAYLIVLLILLPSFTFGTPQPALILPVKTVPPDPVLATGLYEVFNSEFIGSDFYYLIERSRIEELLEELEFQLSDLVGEKAIRFGEMLGAKILVAPSVSRIGGGYTLSIRFINASNGVIVMGGSWQAPGAEQLPGLIKLAFDSFESYLRAVMD